MMTVAGVMGLALLTYCGLQQDGNLDAVRETPPPATLPSVAVTGLTASYDLASGSQVLLQGSTNISAWSCYSSQAQARVMLSADDSALRILFEQLKIGQISAFRLQCASVCGAIAKLSVPVASLQGDSDGMNRDMQSALKAGECPFIQYRLEKVEDARAGQDPTNGKPEFLLRVAGDLTVAGVERTLTTDLTVQQDAANRYHVQAKTPIQMTDFDVKPPTAFLGLIRARDPLSVIFDLYFIPVDARIKKE
ncbi:MAG: YceI family protein [Tepidisphaeraceae bacterium]|jgi:hypothetical protein